MENCDSHLWRWLEVVPGWAAECGIEIRSVGRLKIHAVFIPSEIWPDHNGRQDNGMAIRSIGSISIVSELLVFSPSSATFYTLTSQVSFSLHFPPVCSILLISCILWIKQNLHTYMSLRSFWPKTNLGCLTGSGCQPVEWEQLAWQVFSVLDVVWKSSGDSQVPPFSQNHQPLLKAY